MPQVVICLTDCQVNHRYLETLSDLSCRIYSIFLNICLQSFLHYLTWKCNHCIKIGFLVGQSMSHAFLLLEDIMAEGWILKIAQDWSAFAVSEVNEEMAFFFFSEHFQKCCTSELVLLINARKFHPEHLFLLLCYYWRHWGRLFPQQRKFQYTWFEISWESDLLWWEGEGTTNLKLNKCVVLNSIEIQFENIIMIFYFLSYWMTLIDLITFEKCGLNSSNVSCCFIRLELFLCIDCCSLQSYSTLLTQHWQVVLSFCIINFPYVKQIEKFLPYRDPRGLVH